MRITLTDAGKRFNRDWIFRHLDHEFSPGHSYAITGSNGSGKSTLLQAIAGAIDLSEGRIGYETTAAPGARALSPDQVYRHLSLAAPYLEVIEEMTVTEFLTFHQGFKPFLPGLSVKDIIHQVGLASAADKQIRYYSSGMKQRVRLAQALFSDSSLLLLDEPTTNLDADGISLYRRLTQQYGDGRIVIVSSNDQQEYDFCEEIINIMKYK
ncbi:MAG TPA: ATP-binding cassette domain-containing protein [Puia sp.]|nr:ATP-binding cassette domain-containing protein [Puia sp.]